MRIHDIINEEGEATSTLSNSVASVAFPLFGDQKMIRRAVDPNGYLSGKKKKKKVSEKMHHNHAQALPGVTSIGDPYKDNYDWGTTVAGHDGKKQTAPKASSENSPFKDQGITTSQFDVERKMASAAAKSPKKHTSDVSAEPEDTNTKSPVASSVKEAKSKKINPGVANVIDIGDQYYGAYKWSKNAAGYDTKQTAPDPSTPSGIFKDTAVVVPYSKSDMKKAQGSNQNRGKRKTPSKIKEPNGTNTKSTVAAPKMTEAPELFSDNVIYRLDPENPMDDSEILVIGGAGRYSLKGLRAKARKEAAQLAQDLQSDHGQSFRGGAYNINQLANTLKTIVAAYDQLNKIRSKGGTKARGIRNEDKALIDECMNIAEQWTTKFKSKVIQ
jgi:hypothetical protein